LDHYLTTRILISLNPAKVIDVTMREGSEWVWKLKWMRDLFEWQLVILGEIVLALDNPTFSKCVDFWVWSNDLLSIY